MKTVIMRYLYTAGLYLSVPFIVIRLWWRGWKNPDYRKRISERFGFFTALENKPRIWLHAVSVGETIAAVPLINQLLHNYPEHRLLVTTTTPTGSAQLGRLFPERLEHVYFPYDLPGVLRRFFSRVQPEILVIMETEIWPNLIHHCSAENIPVLLVNARLSPRSLAGYQKILPLIRPVLSGINLLSPQSQEDADRFLQLGADQNRMHICGNMKFDMEIPIDLTEIGAALKGRLGNRPIWIAASTHEGEDEQLLEVHKAVLEKMPNALLILVPRHPERFNSVARLCEEQMLTLVRRSRNEFPQQSTQVYLGDTMGELLLLYGAADIAFVAGSLIPRGGHNPLEPAALGLPVLSGPYVFNFMSIINSMREENAIRLVHDSDDLTEALIRLFQHPEERSQLGGAGRQLIEKHRGATDCVLNQIQQHL